MKTLHSLSGIFIFLTLVLTIYDYFFNQNLLWLAACCAWFALILLFRTLLNTTLIFILLILTLACMSVALFYDFAIDWHRVFTINLYLLTLLIAVGFLRLITDLKQENSALLPKGKQSFFKTYLGIHLFGSVINLSALLLVADRLYKKASLSQIQMIVLTRAFSSDAYWSPFFVAFAAALTYASNLDIFTILVWGLFLALCAFLITYWQLKQHQSALDEFEGYPMHFDALILPFALAFLVLTTHYFYEDIAMIILISTFSFILTIVVLVVKKMALFSLIKVHITQELPKMKNELALFLIAGSFGVMISSLLIGFEFEMPFKRFEGVEASLLLLVLILLSFVGIHPIISIAVIGNWMNEIDHTLLAVTFLMSWATAVSTSPFSGLNLTMQARYQIKAIDLFKINIGYAFKMYLICVLSLFALAAYLQ
jgi:hypothetical protein